MKTMHYDKRERLEGERKMSTKSSRDTRCFAGLGFVDLQWGDVENQNGR